MYFSWIHKAAVDAYTSFSSNPRQASLDLNLSHITSIGKVSSLIKCTQSPMGLKRITSLCFSQLSCSISFRLCHLPTPGLSSLTTSFQDMAERNIQSVVDRAICSANRRHTRRSFDVGEWCTFWLLPVLLALVNYLNYLHTIVRMCTCELGNWPGNLGNYLVKEMNLFSIMLVGFMILVLILFFGITLAYLYKLLYAVKFQRRLCHVQNFYILSTARICELYSQARAETDSEYICTVKGWLPEDAETFQSSETVSQVCIHETNKTY